MRLLIENFKCFKKQEIKINNLTVLVGGNGYGKSSVIQAILLFRNTLEKCGTLYKDSNYYQLAENYLKDRQIEINEHFGLYLGSNISVLTKNAETDYIKIGFHLDEPEYFEITYWANEREVNQFILGHAINSNYEREIPIFSKYFYYLSAEREGPRILQKTRSLEYLNTGFRGETTGQVIAEREGYYKIDSAKLYKNAPKDLSILRQVNYWLNEIIPGAEVNFNKDVFTNIVQILLKNELIENEFILATNIGFGISYVLPIIVTGLISEKNSMFLVENPEAHLHPSAQSKMGEFLSFISSTGVNVIIETHSDHVINGIQIASTNEIISNEEITINFFNKGDDNTFNIEEIGLKKDSFLTKWPKGFFNQSQIDFAKILNSKGND